MPKKSSTKKPVDHVPAMKMLCQLAHGIPEPVPEYHFCERRWRFDFAWPDKRIAVEIEGAVFAGGRHTRGSGYVKDCDKYNTAACLGWRVLRFTTKHLKDDPIGCAKILEVCYGRRVAE